MPTMQHAAFLAPLLAVAQSLAPPFPAYPELDQASTRHVLVVAEVIEQQYLPDFPECGREDVVCMDPPPTWFRARVLQRVHADAPSVEFLAATTDHFGITLLPPEGEAPSPRLMLLATDGRAMRMPRYANAVVARDSRGGFHLVMHDDDTVPWLPCGLWDLAEPINDAGLAQSAALARSEYADDMTWDPEFFTVDGSFAHPRFSIPVAGLVPLVASADDAVEWGCRGDQARRGPGTPGRGLSPPAA